MSINTKKKELKSIHIYVNNINDRIIRARIEHLLDWYIRKSTFYKNLFYGISVLLILINASIPILNEFLLQNSSSSTARLDNSQYITIGVSILSSIATILTSFMTLFTMKDTWFRYRKHVELIKKECMLYNCKSGVYGGENINCILAERIEEIIGNERQEWVERKFNNTESKADNAESK
ncbi:DUF4231 domain-containing protein [Clostridium uliginosum]|uniref:SMODS and SLOG-associating 2TM effector domain-containing protein n=1 Tax=Clostridium uliginosum TaxID=119641 RepID=A0A1I1NHW6_9CLOT|nr:DUF4231 domain-containing protein [Clostridium uliginosum]SFC97304.1 Protein of unknown function [Clostridium uliginosum]